MNPKQLILRCYVEKKDGIWQAFCIDLNLAAQGDTRDEVRTKLQRQIGSYLHDALEGEDKEYAEQLLSRKAPIVFRAKYAFYKILINFHKAKKGINHIFNEIIPLVPHKV
jgi:predicted RNase H-like HicB family nuclease